MCGRYYSLFDKQQVAEHFHVRRTADNVGIVAPNWNVAPGDPQPVIRRSHETNERELRRRDGQGGCEPKIGNQARI
jgi:putative SOS response-associated peptidase YedK